MPLLQITQVTGTAVPVLGADMDTDRIIPSRFLKCITFDELAGTMFYDERFDIADGSSKGHPLDAPCYAGASIIIGGENFGCGSSREHAPQAIKRSGIKAIIAESYSEIFYGNSTGIGLPCVMASRESLDAIAQMTAEKPDTEWVIDLSSMQMSCADASFPLTMPAEPREALMQGRWDAVVELMNAPEEVARLSEALPKVLDNQSC
ncbi:MAG: 3-isopropylmalate dehydratase small subunit [Akkermansia sp.]